jgi:sulfopyruvate decarboxylase subunit alpha
MDTDPIVEALKEAGINFCAAVPCTGWLRTLNYLRETNELPLILTSNEFEAIGICAGAWLGGKKPVLLTENTGVEMSGYAIARLNAAYRIPTLLLVDYRGSFGDKNWWAVPLAWAIEPVLKALRIPYKVVGSLDEVRKIIPRAWKTAEASLYPVAVLMERGVVSGIS